MMSMTMEDLEAYSARISTSIGLEYSTLQSYQALQDSFNKSILQSESSIRGYDNEIADTEVIVTVAKKRKAEVDNEIAGLDRMIAERSSTIAGLDTEITDVDTTIGALTAESEELARALAASDAKFKQEAEVYSTLVYDYIAKEMTYTQQISSIQGESTFLAQAYVDEAAATAAFQQASEIYTGISAEVDTLTTQAEEIQARLIQARAEETTAMNSLSSLYETSLNTQRYYQAVSTQSAKIEFYTKAMGLYNETARMADMYPTQKTYQDAKSIAMQQLNRAVSEKDQATQVVTELQALVNVSQTTSYEAILKSYQDMIDMEAGNVSTFSTRRRMAEESAESYRQKKEEADRDVAIYEQNIAIYQAQYASSIEGERVLRISAQADDSAILAQQTVINGLDAQLQAYSTLYEEETSSFIGYNAIVAEKNKEYEQAVQDLTNYSTFYDSTSIALDLLKEEESRLKTLVDTNTMIVRTQSTIYEREVLNQQRYQTLIEISLAEQELAAMQYRETYARAKKLAIQEGFNLKILEEVQATSTLNGTTKASLAAGTTFTPIAMNMNTPTLATEKGRLDSINAFITSFTAVYAAYTTQLTQLGAVSTAIADKGVALEAVFSARTALDSTGTKEDEESLTKATLSLETVNGTIVTTEGSVATAKNSLQQTIQSFQAAYTSLFPADEIIAHDSTISSFLQSGFNSAVVSAT
jgi:archaellum component FlaC